MLSTALNVEDVRKLARRRLPRGIFDYIDRGAEDEVGLGRLRRGFDELVFHPRVLVDVSRRDLSTRLFDRVQPLPLVIAPTAAAGLVWHQGEIELARAAAKAGIPFTIATGSMTEMERIATEARGELWFQLYMWHTRELSYALIDRAWANGIETLVLTVDTVANPIREYNTRNGYEVPIRASLRGGLDMLMHPRWVVGVLLRYLLDEGIPTYRHYPESFRSSITRRATWEQVRLTDAMGWDDLKELRRRWRGRLILKGVLRADDALRAVEAGVDGLVVSSHGARNLDAAVPPVRALPAIVEAVRGRAAVLADSGVRRGADVLKLLALGADAVLIGRAPLYGTAAGGEAGASHVLQLLRQEMEAVMGFLGCASLKELDTSFVSHEDDRPDHPLAGH
ncbi:alpha-hydroxy acid oxidase [Ancylobacter defluvii]|uniref:Alpha-hydroxy-acid oxidizing enzyme n=1 Tax=Ancylobacter defluvii TaxID=1282440 RepID=A0A9W6JX63_9HYPH|nr:alpha-hydroxy acid oxidase [Ancylobacter defluvii]MBS7589200.1 alpha-hydroxy-acid oxidizing protein [Ancylobacter defluvii]GLK84812.1 alpha-hydroxy-acid oxidizing enzyme [Ancylobacter defluvii]